MPALRSAAENLLELKQRYHRRVVCYGGFPLPSLHILGRYATTVPHGSQLIRRLEDDKREAGEARRKAEREARKATEHEARAARALEEARKVEASETPPPAKK